MPLQGQDAGSVPTRHSGFKELALSQLWRRQKRGLGSDPWPRSPVRPKKKTRTNKNEARAGQHSPSYRQPSNSPAPRPQVPRRPWAVVGNRQAQHHGRGRRGGGCCGPGLPAQSGLQAGVQLYARPSEWDSGGDKTNLHLGRAGMSKAARLFHVTLEWRVRDRPDASANPGSEGPSGNGG